MKASSLSGIIFRIILTLSLTLGAMLAVTVPALAAVPVANFSGVGTTTGSQTVSTTEAVQFTDSSTNTPTSWSWNFGDGATSTVQNPSHAYATAGTKTVWLIATNADGSSAKLTRTAYITVRSLPVANFTAVGVLSGTQTVAAGDTVQFTDSSTQSPTIWSWDFGDSVTSTSQNPTHVYSSVGTYTVSLTATNIKGSGTLTRTNYITVVASMSHTVNLSMTLSASSVVADPAGGDPTKQFTVTVAVTPNGQGMTGIDSFVNFDPSVLQVDSMDGASGNKLTSILNNAFDNSLGYADFSGTNTTTQTGNFNLVVITFHGIAGAPSTSISFNQELVDPPRTTTVAFGGGSVLGTATGATVTVLVAPTANFTAAGASSGATTVAAGETVNFTDTSAGTPTSWDWDFDTSTPSTDSTSQNPTHVYTVAGTYSVRLTATNTVGSNTLTRSSYITVNAGALNHITVSPSNPSVVVHAPGAPGVSQTYTATTYDVYNNARSGDTIVWSVSNATAGSIVAGTGAFTAGITTGSYSNVIVATSGAVTGNASVTVTAGPLSYIETAPYNPSVAVNGSQTFTAVGYDEWGNARTGDVFTWSMLDSTAGSINSSTGVFTAGTVAGSYTTAIQVATGVSTKNVRVTVVAGALDHITVSPASPSVTVGGAQTFTATTYDVYNNARSGDSIAWSSSNPVAGSINASTGVFTAGTVAGTYSNVILATSGAVAGSTSVTVTPGALDSIVVMPPNPSVVVGDSYTYTAVGYDVYANARSGDSITWSVSNATAGSINASTGVFTAGTAAGTYSNVIVATSGAVTGTAWVTVTPDALHHITVSPPSPSLVVGGAQTFTAATYDQYNNARSGDTIAWSVSNATAGSINASTGAFTAGTVAGTYSNVVVATSGAVTGNTSVTVTPGALDHITVSPPSPSLTVGGAQTFTAATYDVYNNARSGDSIAWSVSNATAGSINASTGAFTAGTTAGSYSNVVVATSGAVTGNTSVTVTPGALDHITVSPASPSIAVGGAQTFTAATYDVYNNARSGDTIAWSVSNATAGGINASTGAFTAGTVAGNYSNVVVATSGAVTGNTSVILTAGALHHITISPPDPTLIVGATQLFSATGYDAYDNARTGDTFTWYAASIGTINSATGLFTAGTVAPGWASTGIVATSGGVSGNTSVTVMPGALDHITVSPAIPSVTVVGIQTFTAASYDVYNNPRSGDVYSWSVTNATAGSINSVTGIFTAGTTAGSYTNVIVATSGAVTGNTSVTVTPGALDHITVSPASPSLVVGGAQTFTAATYDQYNNARSGDTIVWSVSNATAGGINASTGAFTAGTVAGTYSNVVVATSGAVTGNTSVTVTPGALDHITVSPASPSLTVGGAQTFTAATYDVYNNARTGDSIVWSVTNATAGSINASTGAFTAGTTAGSYSNVVVATSGAVTGNTSVTVTAGALDHITVSPANPSVAQAHNRTFTAATYDAFNNARSGDPIVWSVANPTAGSINASTGVFTAGATNGTYAGAIVATSGVVTGSTGVTVRDVVTIILDAGATPPVGVLVGQEFPVTIKVSSGTQQVSAVDAFIDFDPVYLEVMQIDQIATNLPVQLSNVFDNDLGTAGYSASRLSGTLPSGEFSVATITFRAKATTTSTPVTFSLSGLRTTTVAYVGADYRDEVQTTAVAITYDVPVSLTGAPVSVDMLTDFTANIVINAGSALADNAEVYLTFDPTYINVTSITDGAFATVGTSTYDNTLGRLTYSASNATALTGSITLATVHFQGQAVTAGTDITISFTDPRKTTVTNGGVVVPGVHGPEVTGLEITPGGIINGTVTLQGSARPAAGRVIPLTVKLFTVDPARTTTTFYNGTGALGTYTPTTANGGTNTVTFQITGLVPGSYDISVSAGHTLLNVKKSVAISGITSVDFGTLLEGNCNNDMQINALDFSSLAASYLKTPGQTGYNAYSDFDYSGQVNSLDFSLLAANYLKAVQIVI